MYFNIFLFIGNQGLERLSNSFHAPNIISPARTIQNLPILILKIPNIMLNHDVSLLLPKTFRHSNFCV